MLVTVFHHDFPDHPDSLTAVATVQVGAGTVPTTALEFAFRRTQNIAGSWSQGPRLPDLHGRTDASGEPITWQNDDHHPAVTLLAPLHVEDGKTYGLRSSMMGDVFEVAGRRYRVAAMGFTEIA